MPGSKRRALKNLLSPHHSPAQKSGPPSGAPLQPVESGASLASISSAQSGASISSNPGNYMTDDQLETEMELAKMKERENSIGHGGLPPAESTPPPPPQGQIGRQGDLASEGTGAGGKKKSSKQKFEERQVSESH